VDVTPQTRQSCQLYLLPKDHPPTKFDIEVGYTTRGVEVLACDQQRELAVYALDQEHVAQDKWKAEREKRRAPWWQFWKHF
jgi:hypothetical protein